MATQAYGRVFCSNQDVLSVWWNLLVCAYCRHDTRWFWKKLASYSQLEPDF